MKVRLTLTEEMLGTASSNPELHREHIASKSADADRVEEELAALSASELIEKSLTVFPRDENGNPFVWDYQIKGHIKEVFGILLEFVLTKEVKVGKAKLSKWTYKRVVDNAIFVKPRKIRLNLPDGGEIGKCTRPLRAETMRGERVALATSETVPAGTTLEFEITNLVPAVLDDLIRQGLDFGKEKGTGQWRNSGKGRYEWEELA
jgi:hypothetical protein